MVTSTGQLQVFINCIELTREHDVLILYINVTMVISFKVAQQNIQGQGTVQQGLLMTTNSILPQVSPSNSSTASGTTSLVTTSVITSTVTSTSGVSSHRKPKTTLNVTTSAEDVLLSQTQGSLVQTGMDSSTAVTSQVMTSDPNSASMKILNPQLQSVLHGQLGGSTAPILLTMNCNGQPTSILVDPTTMQVLGQFSNTALSIIIDVNLKL